MAAKSGLGLEITELRLGLPGSGHGGAADKGEKKRVFSEMIDGGADDHDRSSSNNNGGEGGGNKARNKNQVVGWPPVCSYRRKNSDDGKKMYVKVSMDGAPFLRKIDLTTHKGYSDLVMALEKLFDCCGIGTFSNLIIHFEYLAK